MKILKFMIVPIIFIITVLIINNTKNNKIYYLSLGDELSNHSKYIKKNYINFSYTDIRIIDLISKIKNNEEKNISIQEALKKSDIITISVGLSEIYSKYITDEENLYDYIDEMIDNIEELLNIVRKYNSNTIYILGYYSINKDIDEYIKYANNKLKGICNDTTEYIDLNKIFKNNTYLVYNLYPSTEGYRLIANEILKKCK